MESELGKVAGVRLDGLEPVLRGIQSWSDKLGEPDDIGLAQSVIYYREDDGDGDLKAFYTGDLRLEPGQGARKSEKPLEDRQDWQSF